MMPERYKPFDTAPRDGQLFLAYSPEWPWPMLMWWANHEVGGLFHTHVEYSHDPKRPYSNPPTHWARIPRAPNPELDRGYEAFWNAVDEEGSPGDSDELNPHPPASVDYVAWLDGWGDAELKWYED